MSSPSMSSRKPWPWSPPPLRKSTSKSNCTRLSIQDAFLVECPCPERVRACENPDADAVFPRGGPRLAADRDWASTLLHRATQAIPFHHDDLLARLAGPDPATGDRGRRRRARLLTA